jgi:phospholipid/cholesterol/gamma-HCH transport system substrate-binding protein
MEAEARYTWVGAAVLMLLAALVAAVLWLKDVGGADNFKRYTIHFETQSLEGLDVGGEVKLRGIKVGRVEDFALADQKLNRVHVDVRVDRRAQVRTNTVALVTRNFVTDIAVIELVTREPPGPPLVEVPQGERYPVIAEGHSELEDISGRVSKIGDMTATALGNVTELLGAENRQAVLATIRNLRDLSAGLNQRLGALDRTMAAVGAAARDVGNSADQLGRAGDRAARVTERIGERLDTTLAETERTLADARRAMNQIATAGAAVQQQAVTSARRLEDSAANIDSQLDAAVTELRLSVETATRTLDRLRDPRAALLGPGKAQLGPGEQLP